MALIFVYTQLVFVFGVKCVRYSVGSVRGQGGHSLFSASASQRPVNHKPNESQMNTAACADHRVRFLVPTGRWLRRNPVLCHSATNHAAQIGSIGKNQDFEICMGFLKILKGMN